MLNQEHTPNLMKKRLKIYINWTSNSQWTTVDGVYDKVPHWTKWKCYRVQHYSCFSREKRSELKKPNTFLSHHFTFFQYHVCFSCCQREFMWGFSTLNLKSQVWSWENHKNRQWLFTLYSSCSDLNTDLGLHNISCEIRKHNLWNSKRSLQNDKKGNVYGG